MTLNNLETVSLSRTRRFLIWPSGASSAILARCPSEQNYYCGLGTLVWFNSILAGCGMTLMLSQTSGSVAKAIIGGVFWFLCVVNLDRFLLLATYENTGWKKLMPISRILLSLCLAIIIGEHVVQYIFHNEINNQLAQEKLTAQRTNYDKALEGFPEIAALNDEKSKKQAEIEKAKEEVNRLRADYIGEAEGLTGSRVRGKGPLYEQKERDYKAALAGKQKLETELQEIQNRLDEKSKQLDAVVKLANNAKDADRGFLSYHRALFEIIKQDLTLLFLYLVISSAMILFEITPLFSKLGGKDRLHDFLVGEETKLNKSEEERRYKDRLQSFQNEIETTASLSEKIYQLKRDTLNEVADAIRNNTNSNLSPEKAALAESLKSHVYGSIISQVKENYPDRETERSSEDFNPSFTSGNPASVTVIIREDENEQPFTIVFRHPRVRVQGSDLLYALAGLEQERPAGTVPRIPLNEYRVTNDLGEAIKPYLPLFSQISGGNTVYLSLFEPTVSNAEN
jgi:hypothetical protein